MTETMTIEWIRRDGEAVITVECAPGWLGRLLGRRPERRVYRGSGTVWRLVATGCRAGMLTEARLADAWARARWDRQSPES